MSGRRSDSNDSKRLKRDDRKSPTLRESQLSYHELRDRAKTEQKDTFRRHSDKRSDEKHREEDYRHKSYRNRDRNDDRSGRQSDDRRRQRDNTNDKNNDSFKSEEFWSKGSKSDVKTEGKDGKPIEKQKPNFEITGKLAEDTNTFNGIVIKYNEPLEARKPKRRWRLYPFKGEESLNFIPVHRQSAYLMGRDRKVADIPIDHPSCSKQHAVIQYRLVDYQREDETYGKRLRPYIIDLESANGTYVNNQRIESKRYYELFEKDVIKFGFSTREYVLLHDQSKDEEEDGPAAAEENRDKNNYANKT